MRLLAAIALASSFLSIPAAADDLVPRLDDCCFIIEFEDTYPGECLNEKYAHLGIHMFASGTGDECVYARDVERLGWWSPTLPMAASTVREAGDVPGSHRFNLRFDRTTAAVLACIGNDGPGMSLQYRCDFPFGWGGGWGPLNGNYDLDENLGSTRCDSIWFQDRFGNYPITLDRLQVSFCPRYDTCTVVGDGETYTVEIEGLPGLQDLCSPDSPSF